MLTRLLCPAAIQALTSLLLLSIVIETSSEGVSLVFVFDATGSMSDELAQARRGATQILKAALGNPQQVLHDFVLVPFNDPAIGPVTVTTDPVEFERKLASISVNGGGDCPESAISGILKGLQVSQPRSYVYVFTDAGANDCHLTDQVIEVIQQKKSKVVFVMTGTCRDNSDECYTRIASVSSGEIFKVEKGQVEKVLQSIIVTTLPSKPKSRPPVPGDNGTISNSTELAARFNEVKLASLSFDSANTSGAYLSIPIDSQLVDFTVSLSGANRILTILDNDGKQPPRITTALALSNVKIVKIEDPEPGNWTIRYSSSGAHTLRVTGNSELDFDHRFSTNDAVLDFDLALPRPIAGLPVYTYIRSTGLEDGVVLTSLQFLSLDGRVLRSDPLKLSPYNASLYYAGPHVAPNELFNIQVSGLDKKGYPYVRISSSAISTVNSTGLEECLKCSKDGTSRCVVVGRVDAKNMEATQFRCECKTPYFFGDGITCSNVDECALLTDNCHHHALCSDTYGNFTCDCKPGFAGDGVVDCSNIDECLDPSDACQRTGNCSDTIGSFSCACYTGYRYSKRTAPICADVDECIENKDDCEQACNNTVGSYDCQCFDGYREDVSSTESGVNCTDIDECGENIDNCEQACYNNPGSFYCQCFSGYREAMGSVGSGINCTDVDECMEGTDSCTANHYCVNTPGSFECVCKEGYTGDGKHCENIDECLNSTMNICSPNANCTDTVGSYWCHCLDGYAGDGINCTDVDECALKLDNCHSDYGVCKNADGDFVCSCIYGYTGDGVNCIEVDPNAEKLKNQTSHLSNVAIVLKAHTLEVDRQALEVQHERFLRQCALKGQKVRDRREIIGGIAPGSRKDLETFILSLAFYNKQLKIRNDALKRSCLL